MIIFVKKLLLDLRVLTGLLLLLLNKGLFCGSPCIKSGSNIVSLQDMVHMQNLVIYCKKTTHLRLDYEKCITRLLEYTGKTIFFAKTFDTWAYAMRNHDHCQTVVITPPMSPTPIVPHNVAPPPGLIDHPDA